RSGVESCAKRSGQSDRKTGADRSFHSHHSGSGRDEAQSPLHAGNPRVNPPEVAANSPEAGWVAVALLGKPRGIRGEITALALSSKPERFRTLQEVHLFGPGELLTGKRYLVESTWFHRATLVFKFRGVDTIEDAEPLAGAEVRIPEGERTPLE